MGNGAARVVITGFEAFGGDAVNPTALAMRSFERTRQDAEFVVLPVTFGGAPARVRGLLADGRGRGCLMFGLSRRADALHVEEAAYNATDRSDGGPAVLRAGGAPVLHPRGADVAMALGALRSAGAPCRASSDPGRYVCNATYYETLAAFGAAMPVLFIHVPATTALGGEVPQATLEGWMAAVVGGFVDSASRAATRDA
jgi:pyroglutamyl-peptidase